MSEKIGNITLNYDFYKGADLYSDGDIEEEILEIVKNYDESRFNDVIVQKNKWPVFYHLSKLRQNIIEWADFDKEASVLEIGSGCGAITGCLADKCKRVTCVELSKRRSLINAYRNAKRDNIEIYVSNFEDFNNNNQEKYDYITLIGVFEYSENFINSNSPYVDFLKKIKKFLKNSGKLIIAIENKLGMKYWAGCKEDHIAEYFEGIQDYSNSTGVKTFTRGELTDMLNEAGFGNIKFYYPYPDYKFANVIYSDDYLPKVGELNNNYRNFDLDRLILFDESKAFDNIIKNNLFSVYSNSYLLFIDGKED